MLSGERVLLRPIEPADVPRLWALVHDLEVAVMSSSGPVVPTSLAEYATRFNEQTREPHPDWTPFAIEVEGEVIGACDLHHIHQFTRTCELGIELGRDYWGKGFGQDTVLTLLEYAFEHLNMNRVALYVLADDPRAVSAYRKVGFVEEGRLRHASWVKGQYEDEFVMAIVREEWTPRG